jgi:hypothetical protein
VFVLARSPERKRARFEVRRNLENGDEFIDENEASGL